MQKFVENIRNRHDNIYKVLLFLGTIVFIVFLLPREVSFKYEFQKNKAWQYSDLFAPYSIPLKKNSDDLRFETKQLEAKKKLYFKCDEDVYDQKAVEFELELMRQLSEKVEKDKLEELKLQYQTLAEPVLKGIYKKGLADAQGELGNLRDSTIFYVVKNNVAGAYTKDDVFTLKSAIEFAEHNLRKEYESKEIILKVLEQVLRKDAANVLYDARKTQLVLNAELAKLETDAGMWEQGRLIIRRGENIDQEKLEILNSFKSKYESQILEKNKRLVVVFAQFILVTVALSCFFLFLYYFRKEIFFNNRHLVFLLLLLNIFVLATVIALRVSWLKVYVVPFCLIPVIVRSFFDTRIAFFAHLVTLMIRFYGGR